MDQVCDLSSLLCAIFLSSGRTCTENTSGSVPGLWQVTDSWWMDQIQYLEYKMVRLRNEGDEWQWLRRWMDEGTFTAEGWISSSFMKRIMNELTTAGINFQLWVLVLQKLYSAFLFVLAVLLTCGRYFRLYETQAWPMITGVCATLPSRLGAGNALPDQQTSPLVLPTHHHLTPFLTPSRSP